MGAFIAIVILLVILYILINYSKREQYYYPPVHGVEDSAEPLVYSYGCVYEGGCKKPYMP